MQPEPKDSRRHLHISVGALPDSQNGTQANRCNAFPLISSFGSDNISIALVIYKIMLIFDNLNCRWRRQSG